MNLKQKSKNIAAKKKWSGRFEKEMSKELVEFNSSISFDKRLAKDDILGSIAHCKMLNQSKILTEKEAKTLIDALKEIEREISDGTFRYRKEDEDIHMNIERRLIEIAGETGKKIHSGRSRNDQVALDSRLFTRRGIDEVLKHLQALEIGFLDKAKDHSDFLLPGYTHLQRAQPISLAHHLMAYVEMLERDRNRFQEIRVRVNQMPLGSGALSGSSLPLDRELLAKELDFLGVTKNSMDSVSDRDYIIEFVSAAAICMMHLSRMAEEWILWSTQEFSFLELDESICTGSSMMPQKKNPDLPELVRGKCARVYGNLMTLLSLTKALPLTYNKDLQEDKEPLFDTLDTLKSSLEICKIILEGTTFNQENMQKAVNEPFILATDIAEYLVKKGIPFREAHEIVGKIVRSCIEKKIGLMDLSLEEFKPYSKKFDQDVFDVLSIEKAIDRKITLGGTSRINIQKAIEEAQNRLNKKN